MFPDAEIAPERNEVYEAVREAFRMLRLDIEHYGTAEWNPLGEFIQPGNVVLIKPNLVMEQNAIDEGTDCLYTQPSVVAPVIDYALLALHGEGRIIIGDAPMQECQFDTLVRESGYADLVRRYQAHGYQVELVDFRGLTSEVRSGIRMQTVNENAKGKIVDLGDDSEFADMDDGTLKKMRITCYDPEVLKAHHAVGKHEYYISDYILNADCIINMPKPKTHRKAGVTISLKNFVGINVRKEFLPHHTIGTPQTGGDEYLQKNFLHALRSKLLDKRNHASAHGNYAYAMILRCLIHACSVLMNLNGGGAVRRRQLVWKSDYQPYDIGSEQNRRLCRPGGSDAERTAKKKHDCCGYDRMRRKRGPHSSVP